MLTSNAFTVQLPDPTTHKGSTFTVWLNTPYAITLTTPVGFFALASGGQQPWITLSGLGGVYNLFSDGYVWVINQINVARQGSQPGTACNINMQIGEWYGQPTLCWGGIWSKVNDLQVSCISFGCKMTLSSGMMIQWGWSTSHGYAGTGTGLITYPFPFSCSSCLISVSLTARANTGWNDVITVQQDDYLTFNSTTSLAYDTRVGPTLSNDINIYWMALGW